MNLNEENLNEEINEAETTNPEIKEAVVAEETKTEMANEEVEAVKAEEKPAKGFKIPNFPKNKNNKTKRVLRGDFVAIVSLTLLVIISAVKIPSFVNNHRLEKLGFKTEAIEAIKDLKLSKTIIDNEYYSDYLASEITKPSFKKEYLELYVYETRLTNDDFTLFEKLQKKGYTREESLKIFKELDSFEITPLLVFEKQADITVYINDCLKHHAANSKDALTLSNDYLKPYENVQTAPNIGKTSVLVNKNFDLGKYEPANLKELNTRYAVSGIQLDLEAHDAFREMCDDMAKDGLGIYAVAGYRSYEGQAKRYESFATTAEADLESIRPGFSDQQTGLGVRVVDGNTETLKEFENSAEYAWLLENADKYGFILRYPNNKESITGHDAEPYYFRYVGKDLAPKIKASGLSFEEYYYLHMVDAVETTNDNDNKNVKEETKK